MVGEAEEGPSFYQGLSSCPAIRTYWTTQNFMCLSLSIWKWWYSVVH